jgi:hypothetical protein
VNRTFEKRGEIMNPPADVSSQTFDEDLRAATLVPDVVPPDAPAP